MSDSRYSFAVDRTTSAPPAVVFSLETDGANWSKWAGPAIAHSSWDRPGQPEPGGIGAVRRIGAWPLLLHEQTLAYEQDRRHVYGFASKGPVKDYRAEVLLEPTQDGGTQIRWTGSFAAPVPGTGPLLRALLRAVVADLSRRLVAAAEREAATA